ncbi:hypothetical protein BpHYR1_019354 [Brachionus plicatilis]|uniref:Uncharacterized protein n=1 Tax=Brachionus plicatilis TaxID=10195 RepID=A0A3M7QP18_BRAPC|nr:hypothetical protein BpHYR1_019354 [Brachionus plicatilis]
MSKQLKSSSISASTSSNSSKNVKLTPSVLRDYFLHFCWDPYKRTLNRPKFLETVTVSASAGQPLNGRSFDRSARRSNFWTAKINGLKQTGGKKTGQLFGGRSFFGKKYQFKRLSAENLAVFLTVHYIGVKSGLMLDLEKLIRIILVMQI